MECEKCKKRFSYAGNIRNYQVVCPYCGVTQTHITTGYTECIK